MPARPDASSPSPALSPVGEAGPADIATPLLAWYDRHARELPWRVPPDRSRAGERPNPYRVWLSEVMLQQTTVAAVRPRYGEFLAIWPSVRDLAAAEEADVLRAWAGLGYYRRARSLHACARAVVSEHGGRFPTRAADLRDLPGIGDYTAAAVAAIAHGEAVPVVDGNVERVVARLLALPVAPARAKARVRATVAGWVPADRPGDFAQACMDLGATVCTPRSPSCLVCPLRDACAARRSGEPERWPVREARRERAQRVGAAYVARRPDGAVLLGRRGEGGVLAGTPFPPTSAWSSRADGATDASAAPFEADWRHVGTVAHGFTHFELAVHVHVAWVEADAPPGHWWSHRPAAEGLSTLARKVLVAAEVAMEEVAMEEVAGEGR